MSSQRHLPLKNETVDKYLQRMWRNDDDDELRRNAAIFLLDQLGVKVPSALKRRAGPGLEVARSPD